MASPSRFLVTALLGAALLSSGCSDDDDNGGNGPNGGNTLSAAEQAVLIDAMLASGIVDGPETAALIQLLLAGEVGAMTVPAPATAAARPGLSFSREPSGGAYEAIAFQAGIAINGVDQFVASGLLAWKGLDVAAETVDEIVLLQIESPPPTFPGSISGTFGMEAGASYGEAATNSLYEATAGTASVTSATFPGGSQDCTGIYNGIQIDCSARIGTMSGMFGFTGTLLVGTGAGQITFPTTSFSVPAIQVEADAAIPVQ